MELGSSIIELLQLIIASPIQGYGTLAMVLPCLRLNPELVLWLRMEVELIARIERAMASLDQLVAHAPGRTC